MSWEIYSKAVSIRDSEGLDAGLKFIEASEVRPGDFPPLHTLRASYLRDLGRTDEAIVLLRHLHTITPDDFWINFALHGAYSARKQWSESTAHMHQAHAACGWPESGINGYVITNDYFSPNIPKWTEYFSHFKGKTKLNVLEIGSWQGGSAAWLLDNILTSEDARLTCIDTFEGSSEHTSFVSSLPQTLEQLFDANMQRTGAAYKVRKLKGYSQSVLRGLSEEVFDLIYIDGAHEAKYVIQDAILALPLLGSDSLVLFDDYPFNFPGNEVQNTAKAIDFFVEVFASDFEIMDKSRQVLLRKK